MSTVGQAEKSRLAGSIWLEDIEVLEVFDGGYEVEDVRLTETVELCRESEDGGMPQSVRLDEPWVSFKVRDDGRIVFAPFLAIRALTLREPDPDEG